MSTLQSIATRALLKQIPINDSNRDAIDDFLLEYIKYNPEVLNVYLENASLYHVFFREEDIYINPDVKFPELQLIRNFSTEAEAIKWVKQNGQEIVYMEEQDRNRPVVITIIKMNNTVHKYTHSPVHVYGISEETNLTFSFSERGYNMLMKEHKYNTILDTVDIIPYWMYHYQHDNSIIRGCKLDHIIDMHKDITYEKDDQTNKQSDINEYNLFQSDPDKYILKQRYYEHFI